MSWLAWLVLWILVCFAAGVLEADRGVAVVGRFAWLGGSTSLSAVMLAGLGTRTMRCGAKACGATQGRETGCVVGARRPRAAGTAARSARGGWSAVGFRAIAVALLGVSAFAAGAERHARIRARAADGAALAEAAQPDRVRRIDARVVARHVRSSGDEVELWEARAADGGEAVPDRMLLRLARPEAVTADCVGAGEGEGADEGPRQGPGRGQGEADRPGGAHARDGVAPGAGSRADSLLWPGARVRLAVRITPLRSARNPGLTDRAHALARRGIGARARLLDPDWVVETRPAAGWPARVALEVEDARRAWWLQARARLPSCRAGAGLVRALALGDRGGLDPDTRRRFGALGLAHLLSVSGLHVGFVAWPAGVVVARVRSWWRPPGRPVRGFAAPLLAAALAGGAYAWGTGGHVPALRASALFVAFALARGARSAPRPATVLASIALLLVIDETDRLFSAGARFSFVACAALLFAGVWRRSTFVAETSASRAFGSDDRLLGARVIAPARASLAVSLGLLPWIELEGLQRALLSPLVNLAAIPWTGLVVLPCAFAASVGLVLVPPSWGEGWLAALILPAALLEQVAAGIEGVLPAWLIEPDRAGVLSWPLGIAAVVLGLWALRRDRVAHALGIWLLLGGLGLAPLRERAFGHVLPRIVFLDVGQADAALIETREAAWLIDSGSGPADGSGGGGLVRALRALGVDRLDGLVVSHGDLDHRGGALRLLAAMPIGTLWLPRLDPPDPALEALARAARDRGVRVERMSAGARRAAGQALLLEVLWPPPPDCTPETVAAPGPSGAPGRADPGGVDCVPTIANAEGSLSGRLRNERSLVLRATVAGRAALFAADIGRAVERRLVRDEGLRPVDVLKVAHHGSRASSDPAFLARLAPWIAIVSAPCDAVRGLPSPAVLARLRAVGSAIGWTGRDGAIAVTWSRTGAPIRWRHAPARDCERRRVAD